MDNTQNTSGANTTLLVIILLLLVGFGVWWFTMRSKPQEAEGLNVNIGLGTTENEPTQ